MVLTSLAIEFHCSCCGTQGLGITAYKEQLSSETTNIDRYDNDTGPFCPTCGSKVITLSNQIKDLSS